MIEHLFFQSLSQIKRIQDVFPVLVSSQNAEDVERIADTAINDDVLPGRMDADRSAQFIAFAGHFRLKHQQVKCAFDRIRILVGLSDGPIGCCVEPDFFEVVLRGRRKLLSADAIPRHGALASAL